MKKSKKRGQGSPEFIVVISFVILIFFAVMLIVMQKEAEISSFKVFLDAKRVCNSVAENINTIAQKGPGYYKYFSIPKWLHGPTEYNLTITGNFLKISWDNQNWGRHLTSSNINVIGIVKGDYTSNCVMNADGIIIINQTCTA